MAHSGIQNQRLLQHNEHHCKDCGLRFDSVKSLDVHLHYHKENLLSKWGNQSHVTEESNNNNNNNSSNQKNVNNPKSRSDYNGTIMAPADSSDGVLLKSSGPPTPNAPVRPPSASSTMFPRNSPPVSGTFTRPPTPATYGNTPSPYQSENNRFSPASSQRQSNFTYLPGDHVQTSSQLTNFSVSSTYSNNSDQMRPPSEGNPALFCDNNYSSQNSPSYILGSGSDFPVSNASMRIPTPNSVPSSPSPSVSCTPTSFRYHPYHNSSSNALSQQSSVYSPNENRNIVSSSTRIAQSPSSSTTQQCDKCGFICESSAVLINHINMIHSPTPANLINQQQQQYVQNRMIPCSEQEIMRTQQQRQNLQNSNSFPDFDSLGNCDDSLLNVRVKTEEETPPAIYDLDSHKVHVYQPPPEEQELGLQEADNGPPRGNNQHPHSVSAMLWGNGTSQASADSQKQFQRGSPQFGNVSSSLTSPSHNSNGMLVPQAPPYHQHRPYLPHQQELPNIDSVSPNHPALISSSQFSNMSPVSNSLPNNSPASTTASQSTQKSNQNGGNQSWKSNEARRPKTYNCSACNKWFTSSGHLKRHYNTTLHKNAVKQSGAPDPASLPINQHHHPNREANNVVHRMTPNPGGGENSNPSPKVAGEDSVRSDDSNGFGRITPQQSLISTVQPTNNSMTTNPPNRMAGPSAEVAPGGLQFLSPYTTEDPNSVRTSPVTHPMPHLTPHHLLVESSPPTPHLTSPLGSHLIHHPIPQQPGMQRHPISPQTIFPNGLPPHVSTTQPLISTSQHLLTTTTGSLSGSPTQTSMASVDDMTQNHLLFNGLFPSSVQTNHHPLPSFAQFHQNHMFGGSSNGALTMLSGFNGMSQYPSSGYPLVSTFENVGGLYISPDNEFNLEQQSFSSSSPVENNLSFAIKIEDEINMDYIDGCDDFSPPHHNNNNIQGSSDSNGSIGEDISNLSPMGMCDDPTSTNEEYEQKYEVKSEQIANVTSSTNSIKIGINNNKTFNSTSISNGTVHKCIECDKVFNKACYLTQHNKSFHSGHKPFKCSRCGKRFPADGLYQEHITKHAGDKPYKCKDCPKQFNHKTDLRRHMCLHTGEKPYACDVCGKGFIRKDHMLKHCETHRKKQHPLPPKVVVVLPA